MRLIDADALIQALTDADSWLMYDAWGNQTSLKDMIDNAPTIEKCDIPQKAKPQTDLISRADAMRKIKNAENELTDECERKGVRVARFIIGELPSADAVPQLKQTDTLIIADALRYLAKDTERHLVDRTRADALRQQFLKYGASMCKTEPTVIRCKTLLPTKDFKEWAKRIREVNPNAVVIPCDAEVASAEAEWIPVSERLPENIRPVLVTWKNNDPKSYYQYIVGKHFIGTAHYHKGKWHWYSSVTEDLLAEYGKCETEEFDEAIEVVAWMPLPKPYREESEVEE